jgi:hypothetical protein
VGFERKAMRKRRVASITTDFAALRSVANGTKRQFIATHQSGRYWTRADMLADVWTSRDRARVDVGPQFSGFAVA